jgi:transcriptional regulator with XRE-family HTH domain
VNTTTHRLPGIWMKLIDKKRLARLMAIQNVSARELSRQAGWKSHSYMNRLLRGEASTLDVEPAVRIARYLGVGTDDLFMSQSSSDSGQIAKRKSA